MFHGKDLQPYRIMCYWNYVYFALFLLVIAKFHFNNWISRFFSAKKVTNKISKAHHFTCVLNWSLVPKVLVLSFCKRLPWQTRRGHLPTISDARCDDHWLNCADHTLVGLKDELIIRDSTAQYLWDYSNPIGESQKKDQPGFNGMIAGFWRLLISFHCEILEDDPHWPTPPALF